MYRVLRESLAGTDTPHPVRIWNFIPSIHQSMPAAPGEPHLDRYRIFNLGRFDAFSDWFGDLSTAPGTMPTATGIGHRGHELAIHILAAPTPGDPIENPRQRPAFRYSARYGPRPPCFARATRATINGRNLLLIGGTASVRGEDSVHHGSLAAQLDESVENLAILLRCVVDDPAPLRLITEARVYFVHATDAEMLESELARRLPGVHRPELIQADICREELLVEIEAVADLSPKPPAS